MSIGGLLWYAGAFALALGILIVIHELGHFAVARACGVKVLRFSVGFGKPLLTRRWGKDGTEWSLAAFPLGGYVKMLDEREGEVPADELHRAFNRQSVGRRAAIVVAGPLANLLLAVVLYWGIFLHGTEELRPILGAPPAGSIAANAGVREQETVRAVAGEGVTTWQDLRWALVRLAADRETVQLEVAGPGSETFVRTLDLSKLPQSALEGDLLGELGLTLHRPRLPAVIGRVVPASPAAQAGLMAGDEVLAIDGRPIDIWRELATAIRDAPGQALRLAVRRGDSQIDVTVTPAAATERDRTVGRIGIAAHDEPGRHAEMFVTVRHGPLDALTRAAVQTVEMSVFSLRMIGRMIAGEASWKNVSGPVTIADYAGQSASMGIAHYIRFLALISISLGVLNLLPIPILDGGHLMYYLAEIIKGGPLSERVMEIGQQIGLTLLILLMAFAFYNDFNRLLSG
jgi:regulator of sigma E protease